MYYKKADHVPDPDPTIRGPKTKPSHTTVTHMQNTLSIHPPNCPFYISCSHPLPSTPVYSGDFIYFLLIGQSICLRQIFFYRDKNDILCARETRITLNSWCWEYRHISPHMTNRAEHLSQLYSVHKLSHISG